MITIWQKFRHMRLVALTSSIVIMLFMITAPIDTLLKLCVTIVALLNLGLLVTWSLFPDGITPIERTGLGGLFAFITSGATGLALGLTPIGISQKSTMVALFIELISFWLIAEIRVRQTKRSASDLSVQPPISVALSLHPTLLQFAGVLLVILSTGAAVLYTANQIHVPTVGYTELYVASIRPESVDVVLINSENREISYHLREATEAQPGEAHDIDLQPQETRTVTLPRLNATTTIFLYKDDQQQPTQSIQIQGK